MEGREEIHDLWCCYLLQVAYVPEGLEAIIFTADGDMRQGLNNLQATYSGFGFVNQENVFKVIRLTYFFDIVIRHSTGPLMILFSLAE